MRTYRVLVLVALLRIVILLFNINKNQVVIDKNRQKEALLIARLIKMGLTDKPEDAKLDQ